MTAEFVHLHVHSELSMLDGAIRVKDLTKRVKELGQTAVALTDHGRMHGTLQLTSACAEQGIKAIVGCEVNLVSGSAKDPTPRPHGHLVLLAESKLGYDNLSRIVSLGWAEGLEGTTPRVDLETIGKYREGIVGMTACMGGHLAQEILLRGEAAGRSSLAALKDTFSPGSLYVELQHHGFVEDGPLAEVLLDLAKDLALPTVLTNDCHYLAREDARAQLVLQCIGASRQLPEMERAHHGSSELYVKSGDEMAALFPDRPELLRTTMEIAERCAGKVNPKSKPKLPRFSVPAGITEAEHLLHEAQAGLRVRIEEARRRGRDPNVAAYEARLDYEVKTIQSMGFPGYFLIVADFINWAKRRNIPVGPGRGSGAGSIVAWSLRITDLDPIEHILFFERFLNPERVSMPDFDIDFCMDRRDEVIGYVREKYGATSVGQIATFHELKSKSVVKDVGRVLGWEAVDTNRVSGLIPDPVQGNTVSIDAAMEQEPKLKAIYAEEPRAKDLIDTAKKLENLTRHAGMHAAGIVISEGPLWDHVPVFCPEPGVYVTQYDKNDVEYAGLVKFDFLGLKTLTVLDIAVQLVDKRPDRVGQKLVLEDLTLDDPATYALLQSGETTNVFQLESEGMQGLFKRLRPDTFEDIVAAIALYRPGPMTMIDDFVARKHGRTKVIYPDPCLEKALENTYGVMVYQEQVMEIARTMAGYSLGGADLLRRAMGKKDAKLMAEQRAVFVAGSEKQGHKGEKAGEIFDLVQQFAGYGFNKSHSAAYAVIAYHTAYLKAHFPVEFVCATLSADSDKTEKVVRTVAEARSMGLTVLPPDVNESQMDFTVVYDPKEHAPKARPGKPLSSGGTLRDPTGPRIRFGLGGVKGIGENAVDAIFEARRGEGGKEDPFRDLFDFASRVDLRRVNKGVLEALVQSGAFDSAHDGIGITRAQAFSGIEAALERGRRAQEDKASGQVSLFGLLDASSRASVEKTSGAAFPKSAPWDLRENLQREKSALGFYVSGHPLDRFKDEIARFGNASTASLAQLKDGMSIRIGGTAEGFRERPTKSGGKIGFFSLEDSRGRVEVIVRDRQLDMARPVLEASEPIFLEATLRFEESQGGEDEMGAPEPKLILTEVRPLAQALREKTKSVRVKVSVDRFDGKKLRQLREALRVHPGPCPVSLELRSSERWTVQVADTGLKVEPSEALLASLERLFGEKIVELR